jgi:hypothetical protein
MILGDKPLIFEVVLSHHGGHRAPYGEGEQGRGGRRCCMPIAQGPYQARDAHGFRRSVVCRLHFMGAERCLGEEAGSASASGDTNCFGCFSFRKRKRQGASVSTENNER